MNKPKTEQWRPVVGFEGWYEVSNQGRVKRTESGRIRKFSLNKHGYLTVCLSRLGKHTRTVHSLVGFAFVKNSEGPSAELHHVDDNKLHNWSSNLEWISKAAHCAYHLQKRPTARGENHCRAKLTVLQVLEIRSTVGLSNQKLAEKYGVDRSTIYALIKRETWKEVA
jgi:hypothetical protein